MSDPYAGHVSTPYDEEPVFPDQTRDDDPRSWGEERDGSSRDDEIRREVPPHHADWND